MDKAWRRFYLTRKAAAAEMRRALLNRRDDFPKHFIISAA